MLADTLGEVPLFYAAADIAFVGGSLLHGIGGHNVLEPAAMGRPFCVGAHVQDWREIVDALVECGAARVCDTKDALTREICVWLEQPHYAKSAGEAGAAHVRNNSGSLDRTLESLESLLSMREI